MPIVSIIIPTYNRAGLITETLKSVFAQTYKDYEVIVIDDGSTDNTEEVLAPYMDRIRYIRQENAGVSVARNRGMLAATGEFIAFLDSDDLWYPEKLEKQVACMKEHPEIGMTYTDYFLSADPGLPKESRMATFQAGKLTLPQILAKKSINLTPAVMFRRDLLPKIGLMDSVLYAAEDYDFWWRIIHHTQVKYVDDILVFCREHGNRSIKSDKMIVGNIRSNSIQIARWQGIMGQELIDEMLFYQSRCYEQLGWFERKNGRISDSGKSFIKASTTGGFRLSLFVRGVVFRIFPWIGVIKDKLFKNQ